MGKEKRVKAPLIRWLLWISYFVWIVSFLGVYSGYVSFGLDKRFDVWVVFLGISALAAAVLTGEVFVGQWNAMRDQLKAGHEADRPWIGFHDLDSTGLSSAGAGFVRLTASNAGRSPARVLWWSWGYVYGMGWEEPPPPPIQAGFESRRILVPGTEMLLGIKLEEPRGAIRERLYIFSEILYEDLRSGTRHHTRACWCSLKRDPQDRRTLEPCRGYSDAT